MTNRTYNAEIGELSVTACLACSHACRKYAEIREAGVAEAGAGDAILRARACADVCLACAGLIGRGSETAATMAAVCALFCDQYATRTRIQVPICAAEQTLQEACISACLTAAVQCREFKAADHVRRRLPAGRQELEHRRMSS